MSKQQSLKEHRDYVNHPRRSNEFDHDLRGDIHFTQSDYENSPTKQADAESCDINVILAKYEKTGFLPQNGRQPLIGDFSTMETYHEAQTIVAESNAQFAQLPAAIRERFQNDPAQLLALVDKGNSGDPAANKELVTLGLATVRPEPIIKQQTPPSTASKTKTVPSDGDGTPT